MSTIRFHKTIVAVCTESEYRINNDTLGQLIRTKAASGAVDEKLADDSFRVLLRRVKDEEAQGKPALEALEYHHKGIMEVATAVLITPDIAANPKDDTDTKKTKTAARQKATGFLRSSACVLRKYVRIHGTVKALDPMVHGKSAVEDMCDDDTATKTPEEQVQARLASLMTALGKAYAEDNARGKALYAHCIAALNTSFPA